MKKTVDPLLSFPTVCKRDQVRSRREVRRVLGEVVAVDAIGTLTPGCEIYGLTKGQFSLVDIIAARVDKLAPGYFGEGSLDRDLRRIGFSTDGGRL